MRGDLLTVKVDRYSSGTAEAVIASTTSVNVDFSAEALETTSQTDGLNATFEGGKVTCTISGDYLIASSNAEHDALFAKMNAGETMAIEVYVNGVIKHAGTAVLTSLSMSGGNSDQLATGAFSFQCSGDMATA